MAIDDQSTRSAGRMGSVDDWSTLQDYREGLARTIVQLVNEGANALVKADMGLGKTYTAGHLAQWQSKPITVYTRQWSTRHDIRDYALSDDCPEITIDDVVIAPTLQRHCESFDEVEYPEWTELIRTLQHQGATVSAVHKHFGDDMPCQRDGRCEYSKRADFNPEDTALIIASPQHAYIESYNEDRVAVVDENSGGAYEIQLNDGEVKTAVSQYLDTVGGWIEADTLTELQNMPTQDQMEVINELSGQALIDPELGLSQNGRRADTPFLIVGSLQSRSLKKSMFQRAEVEIEGRTAVFLSDEKEGGVTLRIPPMLHLATNVIALDGTPVKEMWENRLGRELEMVEFLDDEERQEYISEILGYTIYQTSKTRQPYSSGTYVNERHMLTLLEHVYKRHGDGTFRGGKPVPFITSKNAKERIKEFAPHPYETFIDSDKLHFGKIRSHDELKESDHLVVGGSRHPGDREIQRLAALDDYDIPEGNGKGNDKTYGPDGDVYYEHVTHNTTAQAIFRVARTDTVDGADIYVHTSAIPDWIPVEYISEDRIRYRSDEEHTTIRALQDQEVATTAEIADKVDHTARAVRKHLTNLSIEGYVEKTIDRGKRVWIDNGLEDVCWWGEVDLPE